MTWARPWDAPAAPSRACSSLLGCTVVILEAAVYAIQARMMQVGGCHKPEGLPQRCCCVQPLSAAFPAAVTSGSMLAVVNRHQFYCSKVVVETVLEDTRR